MMFFLIGIGLLSGRGGSGAPANDRLLLEDSSFLLLEDGTPFLLE